MSDTVFNLIVHLAGELFLGLLGMAIENKEPPDEYPTPAAAVSAEPLTMYDARTATEAEVLAAAAELPELLRRAEATTVAARQ